MKRILWLISIPEMYSTFTYITVIIRSYLQSAIFFTISGLTPPLSCNIFSCFMQNFQFWAKMFETHSLALSFHEIELAQQGAWHFAKPQKLLNILHYFEKSHAVLKQNHLDVKTVNVDKYYFCQIFLYPIYICIRMLLLNYWVIYSVNLTPKSYLES